MENNLVANDILRKDLKKIYLQKYFKSLQSSNIIQRNCHGHGYQPSIQHKVIVIIITNLQIEHQSLYTS